MADLAVSAHDVKHHAYADDTQLYRRCHAQEATTAAHRLEVCITDVQRWMEANRLKLNTDKYCGPGRDMVRLFLVAVDRHVTSEQGPSEPVTMCVSSVSQYHQTSVLRSMFLAYVRHASIGSVRFVVFDDPSTPSQQRHLYMLSLRLVDYCNTVLAGSLGLLLSYRLYLYIQNSISISSSSARTFVSTG